MVTVRLLIIMQAACLFPGRANGICFYIELSKPDSETEFSCRDFFVFGTSSLATFGHLFP